MTKYRNNLPQLADQVFLTDGGLETTLIFHHGLDLPHFAAFDLYSRAEGPQILKDYYLDYIELAQKHKTGFILESPTWRCNTAWGYKLGYDQDTLDKINMMAIDQLQSIREEQEGVSPIVISGCIGPAGDGYSPADKMSVKESEEFHTPQVKVFSESNADMVAALTMNYSEEAIGIVKAAQRFNIPVAISFTVETDGNLPSKESLQTVIRRVDEATSDYPAYYMINCAHPEHFRSIFNPDENWYHRIKGIRANASEKSHEELDNSESLDSGDKQKLASGIRELKLMNPGLSLFGGCCGTDHTHVEEICLNL